MRNHSYSFRNGVNQNQIINFVTGDKHGVLSTKNNHKDHLPATIETHQLYRYTLTFIPSGGEYRPVDIRAHHFSSLRANSRYFREAVSRRVDNSRPVDVSNITNALTREDVVIATYGTYRRSIGLTPKNVLPIPQHQHRCRYQNADKMTPAHVVRARTHPQRHRRISNAVVDKTEDRSRITRSNPFVA